MKIKIKNHTDIFDGDFEMENVDSVKYLGDILSTDGSNIKNIEAIKSKAIGAVKQIIYILEGTCFGPYFFEVAVVLRNSLLVNSTLTNSEAWYMASPKLKWTYWKALIFYCSEGFSRFPSHALKRCFIWRQDASQSPPSSFSED